MNNLHSYQQLQHWAMAAHQAGWLTKEQLNQVQQLELLPASLATPQDAPAPLIVAFMGGTGVGKSALLNRLAAKTIARSGECRPTSQEVTLFYHHSLNISRLAFIHSNPCQLVQHDDAANKQLVWLDMPDIDSSHKDNQHQVLKWLAHIDVLLYVVSPERYRDQKAWQLLLAQGQTHGWLFVFNQLDKAQTGQFADFSAQLHKAGFSQPLIFKTSCTSSLPDDEFANLTSQLHALSCQHSSYQVQQHNRYQRQRVTQHLLTSVFASFPSMQTVQNLKPLWQTHWQNCEPLLQQGLALPIKQLATQAASLQPQTALTVWDAWAQARLLDCVHDFVAHAHDSGVAHSALQHTLAQLAQAAASTIDKQAQLALRLALVLPGSPWQRGLVRLLTYAAWLLPFMAMTWVGTRVLTAYWQVDAGYLGLDFAVHSSLLIALSWLMPSFMLKKAQPCLQKAAVRGLQKGLTQGLHQLNEQVLECLEALIADRQHYSDQLEQFIATCPAPPMASNANSPVLKALWPEVCKEANDYLP